MFTKKLTMSSEKVIYQYSQLVSTHKWLKHEKKNPSSQTKNHEIKHILYLQA